MNYSVNSNEVLIICEVNNLLSFFLFCRKYKILLPLFQKFEGSFENCIKSCENSAEKLLGLVVDNFPSYRDEATFENHRGI